MPKYCIVSEPEPEPEPEPGAEHREPRRANLCLGKARLVTVIDPEDLFWATRRELISFGNDLH
ncbi:hypothetical protein [Streptomyces sp. NPDC057302]|uniref:hypothetical protein n=1 Tax=Streptomyces sp. NPDC057302 TaxID=3346094 RepID=UPI0036383E5C